MSRILVDASAAFDQRAGIGRYSRNIVSRLVPDMADIEWSLLHFPSGNGQAWQPPARAGYLRAPISRRRFDQLSGRIGVPLPTRLFVGTQDLVYSSDFVAPVMRGIPRVVTVHDIAFLTHPHLTTPGTASFLAKVVQREAGRDAMIATVSETTRERIVEHLGVSEQRVRVIRNGVDERFLQATPLTARQRAAHGVPDAYLLMVGTIEPRKNHAAVLRAIDRHPDGLPLVIVGQVGWGVEREIEVIQRLEAVGRVFWLRNLDDQALPGLYASSRGVLYPSWTEGFGLPVLEALASGRPVVTGTDPVFAEVGGEHVIEVDPASDDALLDGILTLESISDDRERADARRRHAAQYAWDAPVAALVDWIRELVGGRR